ncbi:serine carboxypeptidase domain-containing protein [Ditylenchus destructor]|uniref:Carboxypeptidase n=1 Tax=Ditylenchus destructor TaxID=166010 RepID=A0AAD4NJX3_9BILA|nr:serine carboxypeptidase domain-containing protein [Ditylenchus destructor]
MSPSTLPLFAILLPLLINAVPFQNDVSVEEIQTLPGLDFQVNFKHYSGFLQASPTHFLHYWFVESQNNPVTDPLVFWFNGGPGCSSLDGLLNEMGPYMVNPDGKTLKQNPYAWNKFSSVVYIEAPAGVGFSYATDGNITTDDDQTSQENYEAIKQWFGKFPEYRNHTTFITGESYGGVYVPTLTARIVDGQRDFPINLKGMAIGNGYVDEKLNIDTSVRYAYGHGIIDEKVWNTLELECCRGCIDGCDLTQLTGHCASTVEEIFEFLWHGGLNPYDLYRDCDPNPVRNSPRLKALAKGITPRFLTLRANSSFRSAWAPNREMSNGNLMGGASVPCLNDTDMTTYMNSQDVRQALHIPENLPRWYICSDDVGEKYGKIHGDMSPFIKKILSAHVRVLLYYGDTDMACNFMMGQQFSARLGLKRVLNKQPWKFDRQIAGFKTIYSKGLTFITIRGAGHMAPQWRAPQMDYVMQQFLINHPI